MKIYQVSLALLSSAAAFAPIAPPPQTVKTNVSITRHMSMSISVVSRFRQAVHLLLTTISFADYLSSVSFLLQTKLNVGATWHEPHNENPFQQFVTDMLRVFDIHDDDTSVTKKHYATGFSGDIGKGSTTAYKALNPKPWKAPQVVDETKKPNQFVSDASRVFDIHREDKKVHINPAGFAGDVGHGSTTAYDALPPKQWKP